MKSARIHPVAKTMIHYCQRVSAAGLSPGSTGQVSVQDGDLLWITPADINLGEVQPEQLLRCWPDGRILETEGVISSTELAFLRSIYQAQTEIGAIIRAHPPKALAWALNVSPQAQVKQPFETTLPGFPHPILIVPSQEVLMNWLQEAPLTTQCALLAMAERDLFSWGTNLAQAFNRLEELEAAATVAGQSFSAGLAEPVPAPITF